MNSLDIYLRPNTPPVRITLVGGVVVSASRHEQWFLGKTMLQIKDAGKQNAWQASIVETSDGFRPEDHPAVKAILAEFPGARITRVSHTPKD